MAEEIRVRVDHPCGRSIWSGRREQLGGLVRELLGSRGNKIAGEVIAAILAGSAVETVGVPLGGKNAYVFFPLADEDDETIPESETGLEDDSADENDPRPRSRARMMRIMPG
jgi:hypothetical protein